MAELVTSERINVAADVLDESVQAAIRTAEETLAGVIELASITSDPQALEFLHRQEGELVAALQEMHAAYSYFTSSGTWRGSTPAETFGATCETDLELESA